MQSPEPNQHPPSTASRVPWWLRHRLAIQVFAAVFANSHFLRHWKGFCFPGLNCWACPGANFACPLGALQNACSDAGYTIAGSGLKGLIAAIPVYVIGTLLIFGALFGRMMCGWLCPFGLVQDLVGRLRKKKLPMPNWLSYVRYGVLVSLVLVVPYYTHEAWFSKLCPMGALQGGLLQPLIRADLRPMMRHWWWLKQAILLVTIVAMLLWRRPFCGVVCPLGAIFSLAHRFSAWEIRFDEDRCVHCKWCVRHCPQGIDPRYEVNGHKCIGCLECQKCPYGAISSAPKWKPRRNTKVESTEVEAP